MLKTVRYLHPSALSPQLGILEGDTVINVTEQVSEWTCPVSMWNALRVLGLSPAAAVEKLRQGSRVNFSDLQTQGMLLPPVYCEEVWASGVTYERSRAARNAETQIKESVYDLVYEAERPELFFKSTYERLVPSGGSISLRSDSHWMVPEPELGIVVSARGDLIGYTIGNDLSSRDIEGQNPLYLPQAKIFANSCALGPVLLWSDGTESPSTWTIQLSIDRNGETAFSESVSFNQFRRTFGELVEYLLRDNPIASGTVLLTGTGIVPPDDFSLAVGDTVRIQIDPIGVLSNKVKTRSELS